MTYRKSSWCSGGDCLEVGLEWRKPARSQGASNCVETASGVREVLVRDTKQRDVQPAERIVLRFSTSAWIDFTELLSTAS